MKKSFLLLSLLMMVAVAFQSCSCETKKDIDKYIDNREWDKAYEAAEKTWDNLPSDYVMFPHMSDLVLNGDYTLAKQICSEKKFMKVYFKAVYSNLERIYDSKGIREVLFALTSVPHFDTSKYDNHLGGIWSHGPFYDNEDMVRYNNQMLEGFCDYLLFVGNKESVKPVLEYLMVINDKKTFEGHYDTSAEYQRIKKKFGVK